MECNIFFILGRRSTLESEIYLHRKFSGKFIFAAYYFINVFERVRERARKRERGDRDKERECVCDSEIDRYIDR